MAYLAKFRVKSEFQKDNCIRYFMGCKKLSVLEAVHGRASIRCCASEDCKAFAAKMAVDQGDMVMYAYAYYGYGI